ncbi:MAG: hypothetical protein JSV14_10930 [Deltaproteobacteria bacterium]|nr:MAG: hypothetical protein JSV14_10930 [Deltaproteobacteria bacterium]
MINNTILTEVGQQYATAYEAHYTTKDMYKAFKLYGRIIAAHPDTHEAGYSRSQLQNIVNAVIPKQKVMDALVELGLTHFEQDVPPDVEQVSDPPLA